MKLAINGGKAEVKGRLKPFQSIGRTEAANAVHVFRGPLSGYLAGRSRGGTWVRMLENLWSDTFHVKHSIACNSATNGLIAASSVVGLTKGDVFAVPPMTMSATAAAPMFTGATPIFCDVKRDNFGMNVVDAPDHISAAFVTNLFGRCADLDKWKLDAAKRDYWLIEDNAQSPFAKIGDKYAGTFGDIGVWSLNVHKPIQCGEGGMITTDDDDLAKELRNFINHGENTGGRIGMNSRMPELCAAVASAQLRRGKEIIETRIDQAMKIMIAIGEIPGLTVPVPVTKETNVYYTIPFVIAHRRKEFCAALAAEGAPIVEGYIEPLYRMNAFKEFASFCPVAEELQDKTLFYFDNCAWDLTDDQCRQVGYAFQKVAEAII